LDWKSHAYSKTGVKVENQAKNDKAMDPQRWLIFEKKILFRPIWACLTITLVLGMAEEILNMIQKRQSIPFKTSFALFSIQLRYM